MLTSITSSRIVARAALFLAALVVIWGIGLLRFVAAMPDRVEDPGRLTDAIVVLTGGSERLGTGLALLAEKRARKLFVSGVYRGVEVSELLRLASRTPDEVECCVVLGYAADNTAGNAVETAEWMARENFHSLRLVTAAYHMQRSLLEFRAAMPNADLVPHPVFPQSVKSAEWWLWPGTAHLLVVEYTKFLGALVRNWSFKFGGSR